ncbi:hypothetical protein ASZ90_014363 [hydrocarbon metagenome]|uniref:Uncharacterized protein n=1 Tax=hydrocarbon metagenome TaxID=938273 RepID=A0A0W8F567_9ZZZZ
MLQRGGPEPPMRVNSYQLSLFSQAIFFALSCPIFAGLQFN